jgi:hypothetical protein
MEVVLSQRQATGRMASLAEEKARGSSEAQQKLLLPRLSLSGPSKLLPLPDVPLLPCVPRVLVLLPLLLLLLPRAMREAGQ